MADDSNSKDSAARTARLSVWDTAARPFVTPSLLNCDFNKVGEDLDALKAAGTVAVHLDVMDGHFVPNLTYGAPLIRDWRKRCEFPFDAHLMIDDPARYLDDFVDAGCDTIIFQIEAVPDPTDLIRRIKAAGCRASIALNPPTPLGQIMPFLDQADAVLVMSVMPGFGGQEFDESVLDKVRALRAERPTLWISIDGGVKPKQAKLAAEAGVSQMVVGSGVFRPDHDYAAALAELNAAIQQGLERGGAPASPAGPPAPE